jgi:hypothetical protein
MSAHDAHGYFEFGAGDVRVRGVACSFCGGRVEPGEIDPVVLTVTARADRPRRDGIGVQTCWCHAECLEASGLSDLHVTRAEFWEDTPPED